jgi:hypothetical protein
MSESPYAIPEDELVDSARVPVAEQVAEHPQRRVYGDIGEGTSLVGGGGEDADGE